MKRLIPPNPDRLDPLGPLPKVDAKTAQRLAKFIEESTEPFADFVLPSKRVIEQSDETRQPEHKRDKNLPDTPELAY